MPGRPIGADTEENEFFRPVETGLAAHHVLILRKIEETSRTPHGRLMIFCPPGSAKSTYASVVFPSRYLGREPSRRLILASYGQDLARKMGRRTRSIIRQKRYQAIWKTGLSADSAAADEFGLTNGSEYIACGFNAGIAGNRAHGIIIDDPVKGREAAESEGIRDKTWDTYQDDLLTRLIPGGFVVIIQTRWHQDDLAGRILPETWKGESGKILCRDGNEWDVICLQAKCEVLDDPLGRKHGEYLWPEWFDAKHWAQFEQNKRTWTSLYQQLPRPLEGSLFRLESFLVNGAPVPMPANCDYVFAVIDTATKTGKANDGTAVTFFARSKHFGHPLLIIDWDILQIEGDLLRSWLPKVFARLEELAKQCRARRGSLGAWIEDAASGSVLLQHAQRSGLPARPIDLPIKNVGKVERAMAATPYTDRGDVKFVDAAYNKTVTYKGATRNHLLSQVLGFTLGTKDGAADDALDTLAYGVVIALQADGN